MLLTTFALALSAFAGGDLDSVKTADTPPGQIDVYVTNEVLAPGDSLYDGDDLLLTTGGTGKLVWVDLEPGASFPHKSYYLLVWPNGELDVYKGSDTPYVSSFFGDWEVWGESWTSDFPMMVPGPVGGPYAEIYATPKYLPAGTVLTDGNTGSLMVVDDNAYYFWVDTQPDADFAHPTWHVFIEADGELQTIEGKWPAYLKGGLFLYGSEYEVDYSFTVYE